MTDLEVMVSAYTECALWSSVDEDGDPLDGLGYDVADDSAAQMVADCQAFMDAEYTPDVAALWSLEQFGHDFWLTRNGHGAGFWDRGHGAIGQRLTDAAKVYGSCDLYVGDDHKVYAS